MAANPMDHKRAAAAVPSTASASYRDDPDALSLHTTRDDYEYEDVPELPSYSDSVAAGVGPQIIDNAPLPPADEYQVITTPPKRSWRGRANRDSATPSKAVGCETTIRMDDRLMDAQELHDYTANYLRKMAPSPFVRIQGWHWETKRENNKKEQRKEYDFDIVFSMQAFFPNHSNTKWSTAYTVGNSDKVYRGGFRMQRAPGYKQDIEVGTENKRELLEWCEDFANNKSALKVFRVSRNIQGWDTDFIKNNIVPVIRSTHYRGHIDVSFPVADKNVDIYTPHWVNHWRVSWVRWIFYLTFLWIFTWPILLFLTKRWSVYTVDWRYSICTRIDDERRTALKYCSISEREWLQRHGNLIRSLVLDKFTGDATELPLDVNPDLNRRRSGMNMPATGNANVDTAVTFIQGSVGAWNALNGRGGDSGGWGGDS